MLSSWPTGGFVFPVNIERIEGSAVKAWVGYEATLFLRYWLLLMCVACGDDKPSSQSNPNIDIVQPSMTIDAGAIRPSVSDATGLRDASRTPTPDAGGVPPRAGGPSEFRETPSPVSAGSPPANGSDQPHMDSAGGVDTEGLSDNRAGGQQGYGAGDVGSSLVPTPTAGNAVAGIGGRPDHSIDEERAAGGVVGINGELAGAGEQAVGGGGSPNRDGTLERPLNEVVFGATHNSYSGGPRGSILNQLHTGIRGIELDFHDNGFQGIADWRVGHDSPGEAVQFGMGNPETDALSDWLRLIMQWSVRNVGHAPITLVLDSKDPLDDNPGPNFGNLGTLNERLKEIFGDRLVRAHTWGERWPTVASLVNAVIIVLSGDVSTRIRYLRDEGITPTIAVNDAGQIIEVHDSGRDVLWYWTGERTADGGIRWLHHGRLGAGRQPAVAMTPAGKIALVFSDRLTSALNYRVGLMQNGGLIEWSEARRYDRGVRPSLAIDQDGRLHEIHQSQSNEQLWQWRGVFVGEEIRWSNNERTDAQRFDNTQSLGIQVRSAQDQLGGRRVLQAAVNGRAFSSIQYEQIMFVEFQPGNGDVILQQARFFASRARDRQFLARWSNVGLVRGWSFSQDQGELDDWPAYPAVDSLLEPWYGQGLHERDAPDWPTR